MKMWREWAMPDSETFKMFPVGSFVQRYAAMAESIVDPFARNSTIAHHRNDLNPGTAANHHLDAVEFLRKLAMENVMCDLLLFDPPYSPRQISEVYQQIGRKATGADTQNASLYRRVRDAAMDILTDSAVVLSFGWNSNGMGKARGFDLLEVGIVAHGGAHNDTFCLAEKRTVLPLFVEAPVARQHEATAQ